MQTLRIKNISIRAFRGIPSLEVALDGKSILLKGGNGTGKSSIIEALEFFFSGRVSHLEGTQGISLRRHAPHVLYKPKDVEVGLTFDPGKITLKRTISSAPAPPKQLTGFLEASSSGTFILRRWKILEFVESDPAHRFIAIGNIMGLGRLDTMELEMMRLRDEIEGNTESDKEQLRNLFQELTDTLGESTQTLKQALQNLNKKATEYGYSPIKSFKEVDKYVQGIFKKVKRKADERDQARKLREVLALVQKPVISGEELQKLQDLVQRINQLVSEGTNAKVVMLEFLERGKSVLEAVTEAVCPFCGQEIDREGLLPVVEERIRIVSQLTTEASNARIDSVGIIKNLEALGSRLSSVHECVSEVRELGEQAVSLTTQSRLLSQFIEKVSNARDLRSSLDIGEFFEQSARIKEAFDVVHKESQQLLEKVGLTEDEERILEFVQLLGSVESKVAEITKLEDEFETQNKYYVIADLLYTRFSSVKKEKVQTTYNALESDIQRYFDKLHPNEVARSIKLQIFPSKRASTKLLIDSLGTLGQDPRALESEGHLDSLGICIFLAFVKKFNENCPLVILDDVVTTIDAGHRQKLAEVLLEEFKDKQLIVTTHDEIWFEQFRAIERAYNLDGDFKNMEIIGWDVNSGPRIRGYKPRWESIEDKIRDGDKFSAGNESRRYLEWVLESLCEGMQVPVAFRKAARYEVGDLLPPVRKRVLGMLEGSGQEGKFESAFRDLEKTVPLGNLLSHNNIFASDVSLEEVGSFLLTVKNLQGVFSCPDCGSFISYYRDLEIIRCSNPRCKNPIEIRSHH